MFNKFMRECFAKYEVRDDCGTKRYCWTESEAMDWLPSCSTYAAVLNRRSGEIIIWRYKGVEKVNGMLWAYD